MKKAFVKHACMIGLMALVALFSGCTDGKAPEPAGEEPAFNMLFEISDKDFEDGYFSYMVEFEQKDDCFYEVTYPLRFSTYDQDGDWKVYVYDSGVGSNVLGFLEKQEPALVNSGEVEVVSGQWIFVVRDQDVPDAEAKSKGRASAGYFARMEKKRDVTAIFKYMESAETGLYLHFAYPPKMRLMFYELVDVTGDGVEDCCTSEMIGSGMSRTICVVYDPVLEKMYVLDGYNYSYIVQGVVDGQLSVLEKGPYGYGDPLVETLGTVRIEGDQLVFVPLEERE